MERLRRVVNEIAYTNNNPTKLSPLHISLLPFLSISSSFYKLALSLRHYLYKHNSFFHFHIHRLPVPVISVGNLTWGGNGKTPMVEFIASYFSRSGISPLLLSRGYGGGDEVNMLQRHLLGTPTKFGVGANRTAVASSLIERYGYIDIRNSSLHEKQNHDQKAQKSLDSEKIGVVVLDDAMQVSDHVLEDIESMVHKIKKSVPIFFTKMDPTYLFEVGNINSKIPLTALHEATILCVSAIGSADPFVKRIQEMGALYVDRIDFSDHHIFHSGDISMIRARLKELERKFGFKPFVVITEKDYDRDPEILKQLYPFNTFVLCSTLRVLPYRGNNEDSFKKFLKDQLKLEFSAAN